MTLYRRAQRASKNLQSQVSRYLTEPAAQQLEKLGMAVPGLLRALADRINVLETENESLRRSLARMKSCAGASAAPASPEPVQSAPGLPPPASMHLLLDLLMTHLEEAVVFKDAELRYTWANTAAARLFHAGTPERLLGKTEVDFFAQPDAERLLLRQRKLLEGGRGEDETEEVSRLTLWNGATAWIAFSEVPILEAHGNYCAGLLIVCRDVGQVKRHAEALQASEMRTRHILEHTRDVLYEANLETNHYSFVSPSVERQLGYTAEEFRALGPAGFEELLHPDDAGRARSARAAWYRGEQRGMSVVEVRVRHKDGSFRWLSNSFEFLKGEDGRLLAEAGCLRDITEYRAMEEALRQSRDRFLLLFQQGPMSVLLFDTELHVTAVNDQFLTFAKATRRDLLDFDLRQLRDSTMVRLLADTLTGSPQTYGGPYQMTFSGEQRWLELLTAPLRGEHDEVVGGALMLQDVTEKHQDEERLRASEERYRGLFSMMMDGFILCDVLCDAQGRPSDFRFLEVNAAVERIAGLAAEDIRGRRFLELWPGADRDWIERFGKVALEAEPAHFEKYTARFRKHLDVVAYRPQEGRFAAMLRDVTEMRQAERTVRQEHELFSLIMHNSPVGMIMLNADGRLVFANERAETILGLEHDAAAVPMFVSRRDPESELPKPRLPAEMQEAVERCEPFQHAQYPYARPDGREVWLAINSVPLFSEDDACLGFVSVFEDVTAHVRADAERREVEGRLQQTQKLESLGVLAGGIAHDFNNLLMGILGNAELVLDDLPANSLLCENMGEINKAARRAAELAQQMLAYSGRGSYRIDWYNLNTVVREMAKLVTVSISKKVELVFNLDPDLPMLKGDTTQIRQIVMNLITNAADAIGDEAGLIRLSTAMATVDEAYLQASFVDDGLAAGEYVFFEVRDTGSGMDAATVQRIFDPFFTTKFTGRGLGLAAVLGIIRAHKGAIRVDSAPGEGTTIRVLLPHAESRDSIQTPEVAEEEERVWRGNGVVLVVDDQAQVLEVAKRMLERMGFSVLTASSGFACIDLYRKYAGEVACVIVDLTMPDGDGEFTVKALREMDAAVPVVLASGYSEHEVAERFAGQGVRGFLEKPYRMAELRNIMRAALEPE